MLVSGAPGSTVDGSFWADCAATASNECQGYDCQEPAGTRGAGEPCLVSNQCASLACVGTPILGADGAPLPKGLQCGTCAAIVADGAACDPTKDACATTSSCFGGVCRPRGLQGAPCAAWSDCDEPDFVCKSSGVCDVVTADGAPCGGSSDCASDTGCDASTHVCEPLVYEQPGMPCDDAVVLCESGACDAATRQCPLVLTDGSPCDPTDLTHTCDVYAYCFGGRCVLPDPSTCG